MKGLAFALCLAFTAFGIGHHATANETEGRPILKGVATVALAVNGEVIEIEVDGNAAPVTAGNFVDLVSRGVYKGTMFHRVIREPNPFVVQGGDPQSRTAHYLDRNLGTGGFIDPKTRERRMIPLEILPEGASSPLYSKTFKTAKIRVRPVLNHKRGAIAMARSQFPDSASSQFYFALADLKFLDGSYAVFGYVTKGMDVVDRIQKGDRIDEAEVTKGLELLQK